MLARYIYFFSESSFESKNSRYFNYVKVNVWVFSILYSVVL